MVFTRAIALVPPKDVLNYYVDHPDSLSQPTPFQRAIVLL